MPTNKPNVLVFFTDDQRFDAARCLGDPQVITPNIDRLAARGTVFTHAHIPSGTSAAVCMPSRAMLHSGRTLFHLEGAGERIPTEHTTLGQALRENGYRTFGTGKWHNGTEAFNRSFSEGDEIFFGGMADHWNVPAYHYDPSGRYDATCLMVPEPAKSNKTVARRCDHIHAGRHSTDILRDSALSFLRRQDGTQPFFAYVSLLAPHDPRTMPRQILEMYDPEALELPPSFMPEHPFDNGELKIRDELLAPFPRTPEDTRRHLAEYYAMISHLDAALGSVLDELDAQGLADNTIIVFAGDNGLALGRHGLFGKQSCYDHSIRVPLIFAGPGIPAGVRTDALVYLLDIFPTLCDLTGTPIPASVEGRSMAAVFRDPGVPVRDSLYFAYCDRHRAVRKGRHKLIEYVVNQRHSMTQLFDLAEDPWELTNLANSPTYRDTVADLRREMLRLRDEWHDRATDWGRTFWSHCNFA
ncbi:MAG: sulfatase-like hydrolase/transferase [Armatimonadetes bacterium]|nr:sulfatase-like hydrolase/transferase [Armatimonadota bacterium]